MLYSFQNEFATAPFQTFMSTLARCSLVTACVSVGQLAYAQDPKQAPSAIRDAKVSDAQRLAMVTINLASGPPFTNDRKPPQGQKWLCLTTQLSVAAEGTDLPPGRIALVSSPAKTYPAVGIAIGAPIGGKYSFTLFEDAKFFGNRGQIDKNGKLVFVLVNLPDGLHLSFQKKDVGEIRLLFAVPEAADVPNLQLGDAVKLPVPPIR